MNGLLNEHQQQLVDLTVKQITIIIHQIEHVQHVHHDRRHHKEINRLAVLVVDEVEVDEVEVDQVHVHILVELIDILIMTLVSVVMSMFQQLVSVEIEFHIYIHDDIISTFLCGMEMSLVEQVLCGLLVRVLQ